MSTPPPPEDDSFRFGAALDELQQLVSELESDRLDVDHLTQRVERATELVMRCREELDATRFHVEELLVRLEDVDQAGGPADDPGADPEGSDE